MKFTIGFTKKSKSKRQRRVLSDFYQNSVNSYGKQQMKSLIDKGLSIQW